MALALLLTAPLAAQPQLLPPPPPPCPQRWTGLIGKYAADTVARLLVAEKDGALQLYDSAYTPLRETGRDSFVLMDGTLAVFARDTKGCGSALSIGATRYARAPYPGECGRPAGTRWPRGNDSLWEVARKARPPREQGRFSPPDLVNARAVEPGIRTLPGRRRTRGRAAAFRSAWLQRPVARALARAHRRLRPYRYGILVSEAYRPWYITEFLYLAAPPDQRGFFADPGRGSQHNRGIAADVTLYDLATGREADMGYNDNELSERAAADYPGGTSLQRWHRMALRTAMAAEGFRGLDKEWWHFRYASGRRYPIINLTLDQLSRMNRKVRKLESDSAMP